MERVPVNVCHATRRRSAFVQHGWLSLIVCSLTSVVVMSGAACSRDTARPLQDERQTVLDRHKALVRRWIEEGFNGKDVGVVDAVFAENFILWKQPIGRDVLKQNMTSRFAAFPDLRVDIVDVLAEGDTVSLWYTAHGTQQGEFEGVPATNRQVSWSGADRLRVEGNRLVEGWFLDDSLGLLRQLGMTVSPAARD